MFYNTARNIKEWLMAILMVFMLVIVIVGALCLIFPDEARHIYDCLTPAKLPQYASTTPGATYYPMQKLPECFANYLGYKPQMVFEDNGNNHGKVTFTLKGGYTVSATVKQFGAKMWALEVPAENADFSFKEYDLYIFRYDGCFSRDRYLQARNEYKPGLFYSIEGSEEYFQKVTGRNGITLIHTMNAGKGEFYLATSDGKAKVTMDSNEIDYLIQDEEFLVSGQALSQLLYDWELATNQWGTPVYWGELF